MDELDRLRAVERALVKVLTTTEYDKMQAEGDAAALLGLVWDDENGGRFVEHRDNGDALCIECAMLWPCPTVAALGDRAAEEGR